jgi:hypothetical protein
MEKRSNPRKRGKIETKKQVKPPKKVSVTKMSRKTLRLRYPVRYVFNSTVTGERIEWNGAGSIASVHPDDVTTLLAKFKKNGCCGSTPQKVYLFEEVT